MIRELFALAVVFGLFTSAVIHFVWIWPRQEPPDDDHHAADSAGGTADQDRGE